MAKDNDKLDDGHHEWEGFGQAMCWCGHGWELHDKDGECEVMVRINGARVPCHTNTGRDARV